MSKFIPREPTPAEVEAEVARLNAERVKLEAEAREALAKAEVAEIDTRKKLKDEEASLAADVHHHVYRFNGGVSSDSVSKAIVKLTEWHRLDPECDIEIIFHSPGGGVIEGFALFDHLRWLSAQGHKITTGCTGMAASMAGILVQAGDYRWCSRECWYMIHRVSFGVIGSTYEVEDEVEFVKRIEKRIISIFAERSDLTPQRIKRNWERKNWWIDSDQALEYRLVDEVRGPLVTAEAA